jgi:hypothetical protein
MLRQHVSEAHAVGERWAENRADLLDGDMPAIDWPESWSTDWDGELPEALASLPRAERELLLSEAHRAAAERWGELVLERRDEEDWVDEEQELEARARALFESVRADLPGGLVAQRDGPRVFLTDENTGEELTITSLPHAWIVIETWRERSH